MVTLQSGNSKLVFQLEGRKDSAPDSSGAAGYSLLIENKGKSGFEKSFKQEKPVKLQLFGSENLLESQYYSVEKAEDTALAKGKITTPKGSVLVFEDTYNTYDQTGSFKMYRKVVVEKVAEGDLGFSTCYSINPVSQTTIDDYDMFAPGVWYKKNQNVVKKAIASNLEDNFFYIREMRLALPVFMMKNTRNGDMLSVCHLDANPSSNVNEASSEWIVDESVQYGSLGIRKIPQLGLDFVYPGSEGEKNYVNRQENWVRRSHPIKEGIKHEYGLIIRSENSQKDYTSAMTDTWRYFYDVYNPKVKSIDVKKLYKNGMDMLDIYSKDYNGVTGLPFMAQLVEGEATGKGMVMGFVGQQLPAAYQMLRYGFANSNQEIVKKASAMVDFWATRSMTDCGLPKTWYEPYQGETGVFTNTTLDMRTMSDGMEGAIDAWQITKKNGTDRTDWLDFCKKYADWLCTNQNDDGSFYRLYDLQGNVAHQGKFNTTNPIRFLTKMHLATKEPKYRDVAIKAGEFSYENIYQRFMYVGGTSDNDNTIDKEAGVMAMNAFQSLYDLTKDQKWLEAFKASADFAETWTYAWDYTVKTIGTRWTAKDSSKPQWIMVDLGQVSDIAKIETYFELKDLHYQYLIEYSDDQINWKTFADRMTNNEPGSPNIDTGTAKGRYVRMTVADVREPDGSASGARVSIWEISVLDPTGKNLSEGKEATASSIHNDARSAGKAFDGAIDSNPYSPYPECGMIGQSLVATGHSYTDMYMAYCGASYYRLYLFTGDKHYLSFAKILQNNANSTADVEEKLGYKHPGIVEEGASVDTFIYNGVGVWLTWCTIAQIEPLSILEDRFGSMLIDEIEQLPLAERTSRNNQ